MHTTIALSCFPTATLPTYLHCLQAVKTSLVRNVLAHECFEQKNELPIEVQPSDSKQVRFSEQFGKVPYATIHTPRILTEYLARYQGNDKRR